MSDLEKTLSRLDRCVIYLIGDPDIPEDKGLVHDIRDELRNFRQDIKIRLYQGDQNFTRLEAEVSAIKARCDERFQSCPARTEGMVRKIAKKPFIIGGSIITVIGTILAIIYEMVRK